MAKATEKDIDAAGAALGVLNTIASGYYPGVEDDAPLHFDPEDKTHLSLFYRLMVETLDASPGWQNRVIGGMCYVILYQVNEILDPAVDTLELHPQWVKRTPGVTQPKQLFTDDEVDTFYEEWEFAEEDPGRIEFRNLVREIEHRVIARITLGVDAWEASAAIKDAEIQELRDALDHIARRLQMDIDDGSRPDQWSMEDLVRKARAALQKASN